MNRRSSALRIDFGESDQHSLTRELMQQTRLVNDTAARRYRLMLDDVEVGYVEYDPVAPVSILLKHTEVLAQHEGKGLGSQLVRGMLDDIRRQGKTVIPICPYALNFIRRHREYWDVVRADMRKTL